MPSLDTSAIHGEPGTGYEPRIVNGVDKGPFECGNCHYFTKPNLCGQKDMMANTKRPKAADGRVLLAYGPLDCCEYVERKGGSAPSGNRRQRVKQAFNRALVGKSQSH